MKTKSTALHKTHSFLQRLALAILFPVCVLTAQAALTPFGPEFTYQGRLNDASGGASGHYDFRFALQDAVSGGAPIVVVTNQNVAVSNGLFTTQINFGPNMFTGFALWLDIGVRSNGTGSAFTILSPRQPLTPTPYAHYAAAAGQVAGSVPDARLSANVALRAGGNSFTGNQSISAGGLSLGDANASITFPAVGGANSPMIHMFASGTVNADRMVLSHSPFFSNWGLQYQDSGDRFNFLGNGNPVMTVMLGGGGRVGIGMGTPELQLDVAGSQGVGRFTSTNNNNGAVLILRNTTASPTYIGAINFDDGGGTPGQIGYFADQHLGFRVNGGEQMSLDAAGNLAYVGQLNKLDVADNFTAVVRAADFTMGHSSRHGSPGRALVDFTDTLFLNFASDWAHTFIGGDNVSVCSLTIRGGCDIAEPFQMSKSEKEIPRGAVVVIDEANPGHLKMSDRACDRRVAGIISGANGVNTGVKLTQEGVFENGQNVALSGRVYVQADAGNGAIVPGDLLTTSDVPGHAMKVTDPARAQGAILGKAMTGLKTGQGFVLVLVSLQ